MLQNAHTPITNYYHFLMAYTPPTQTEWLTSDTLNPMTPDGSGDKSRFEFHGRPYFLIWVFRAFHVPLPFYTQKTYSERMAYQIWEFASSFIHQTNYECTAHRHTQPQESCYNKQCKNDVYILNLFISLVPVQLDTLQWLICQPHNLIKFHHYTKSLSEQGIAHDN